MGAAAYAERPRVPSPHPSTLSLWYVLGLPLGLPPVGCAQKRHPGGSPTDAWATSTTPMLLTKKIERSTGVLLFSSSYKKPFKASTYKHLSIFFIYNCTNPGSPPASITLASVTSFDQTSYCHFLSPSTPHSTRPVCRPTRMLRLTSVASATDLRDHAWNDLGENVMEEYIWYCKYKVHIGTIYSKSTR